MCQEARNKKVQTFSNEVSPTEEENKCKYYISLNKDNSNIGCNYLFMNPDPKTYAYFYFLKHA